MTAQRDRHRSESSRQQSAHRAPPASEARTQRDRHRSENSRQQSAHRAPPASEASNTDADQSGERAVFARNLARQREIYGEPLGDRIRRMQTVLGVSQARLADGLGLSTAMLSQLVSARRVKIGDPAVLARMTLLDRYVRRLRAGEQVRAEELLARVRQSRPHLGMPGSMPRDAAEMLRAVAEPAQLAAAASVLGPRFPAIAELLRRAAADRR